MKKTLVFLLLLLITSTTFAQKYKITYFREYNGKTAEKDPILVFASPEKTYVTSEANLSAKKYPFEDSYINRSNKHYFQQTFFSENNSVITMDTDYQKNYTYEFTNETETILGYVCKKAVTVVKSNKIELWYTNDLKINGAPSDALRVQGAPSKLGQELGLVLKMSRNNNFITFASKIEEIAEWPVNGNFPDANKAVDMLTYEDLLWKSRFINIPIFNHDTLNFYGDKAAYTNKSGVLRVSKGTVIVKKIKFPKINPGQRVFIDAIQYSNGDAYDRTGSIFIIPESKISLIDALKSGTVKQLPTVTHAGEKYYGMVRTNDYTPMLELMRFFTPFGVGAYNHYEIKGKIWADSILYRQDISDLSSELSEKEIWVGANIENYDANGHMITANITIHPAPENNKQQYVLPLINTLSILTSCDQGYPTMLKDKNGLTVSFTLTKDVKNAQIRYTSTGHGGWGGGDEFVPKLNSLYLNGKEIHSFIPWRSDCGSFRLANPSSGNFQTGLSSSDLSRANWCPGSVTSPAYIPVGNLKAGKYTFTVKIPQGLPEGSSFSHWTISTALIGDL